MAAKNSKNASNSKASTTKKNQRWGLRVGAVFIITLVLGLSLLWRDDIDRVIGLTEIEEGAYGGTSAAEIIAGGAGGDLIVHFVDVGQGDACIVELPDGRTMLIDAGPGNKKEGLRTYIDENFVQNRTEKKLTKFDFAILTHSDEDHCGGFPYVLERYAVGLFYRPNELSTRAPYVDPDAASIVGSGKKDTVIYRNTLEAAYRASDDVVITYAPNLGDSERITPEGLAEGDDGWYEVLFFGPYGHSYKDLNNYSPIIIIDYNGKRIALSGDAEKDAEKEFVENVSKRSYEKFNRFTENFTVHVIKLGHHGSRTSSSADYLGALTNSASRKDVLTVISCGFGNSYGHPHPEVLKRLEELGFDKEKILRTDELSHIVLCVRGQNGELGMNGEPGAGGALLFGATSHNVEAPTVHEAVSWLTVALTIWVLLTSVILIQPILAAKGKKK